MSGAAERTQARIDRGWRGLTESSKILVIFYVNAGVLKEGIAENRIRAYSYVLQSEGHVPLGSIFSFNPSGMPYSGSFGECLDGVCRRGYLRIEDDRYRLTDKGIRWVEHFTFDSNPRKLLAPVSQRIQELDEMDRGQLFDTVAANRI